MFHCNDDKNVYSFRKDTEFIDKGFCGKASASDLYAIVMPHLDEGSLEDQIKRNEINFSDVKKVICDTILNLREAVNTIGFIHRDVHLNNIFPMRLSTEYTSLLIDYGNSFVIPRYYQTSKSPEELFGYNVMVYQDIVYLLTDLKAVYLKKDYIIPGLSDIEKWIEGHYKKLQKLDIQKLLRRIMALEAELAIPDVPVRSSWRTPDHTGVWI